MSNMCASFLDQLQESLSSNKVTTQLQLNVCWYTSAGVSI